jgi:hypothetical protein
MYRIDNSSADPNANGAGKSGFRNQNPASGVVGTVIDATFMNNVQEELVNVVTAVGIALDPDNKGQMLAAIRAISQLQAGNYGVDTGTANAYAVTLDPAISALGAGTDGLVVRFKVGNTNTGASTLSINGLSAVSLVRQDGSAVQAGDLVAGGVVSAIYEQVSNKFFVTGASGSVSGLKALAFQGFGTGLEDDGSANARVTSPVSNHTGTASYTFAEADRFRMVRRSNSGSAMTDTLPGATAGVLASGWSTTIVNLDSTASETISVGAGGGTVNGAASITLLPGQSAVIASDGTNYWAALGAVVAPADTSLVMTGGRLKVNETVSSISGSVAFHAAQHFGHYVSTAAATVTFDRLNTLGGGTCASYSAEGGAITLTPNSNDAFVAGAYTGAAGASYTIPQGASAFIIGDGASSGLWHLFFASQGELPVGGVVFANPGFTPPATNFLRSDGSQYSRSSYPTMAAAQDAYNVVSRGTGAITTTSNAPPNVVWGAGPSLYVIVGKGGVATTSAQSSPDGATWTARTMPSSLSWFQAAYIGATVNAYVAIASTTANSGAAYSGNGTTWSSATLSAAKQWSGVAASSTRAVAVCNDDGTVSVTTNASTWSAGGSLSGAGNKAKAVFWSPVANLFIAVEQGNNTYWTSLLADSWTARTFSNGSTCEFVASNYSGAVATVASTSTHTFIMLDNGTLWRTTDAINWVFNPVPIGVVLGVAATASMVMAMHNSGYLITSVDGGDSWCARLVPNVTVRSGGTGFSCADGGTTAVLTGCGCAGLVWSITSFNVDTTKFQTGLPLSQYAEYIRFA